MPWQPLPRIAFAVATYPFAIQGPDELPLEIGDDLYIVEETPDGQWLRGWLMAPPSLLAGLTSQKGQALEARVFTGIFPRSCVEIREILGSDDASAASRDDDDDGGADSDGAGEPVPPRLGSDSAKSGVTPVETKQRHKGGDRFRPARPKRPNGTASLSKLSLPVERDPDAPRPPAPFPMLRIGDETPTSASEPLIDEIASCLREWHSTNLHQLLLSRQYHKLDQLGKLIRTLDMSRRQFLHNVLTDYEYHALRNKTVWDLVKGNKLCGAEVIVRDPQEQGSVLTGDDSVVAITKLQSVMSLLDDTPKPPVESTALHHLLVDVGSFAGSSDQVTKLVLSLVSRPLGGSPTALSESYMVEAPSGGTMAPVISTAQMRTLFTDLSSVDVGDGSPADTELYLVVKILTSQRIHVGKPPSRAGHVSQAMPPFSKDKPPSTSGNKASRRSLMWGSTRSAFSRGTKRPDALSESADERSRTDSIASRDGGMRPSTAGSRGSHTSLDSTQHAPTSADRMLGMGVLKLNPIMKQEETVEHLVPVWSPAEKWSGEKAETGDDCSPLVRELMKSGSGQYERSVAAERLRVDLKPFNHPDSDALIKATPTLLSGISRTSKMGFSGAPTKPRSDIYITIKEALLSRQNLLSRFGGSATSISSSMYGNNLQLAVEVRRQSGERIDGCIFPSSDAEGLSTWKSIAVGRGEHWDQTLRLSLSPSDVMSAHVQLVMSDLPHAPFAITYIPLWHQQAFVRDGMHSLLLYRYDENTQSAQSTGPSGRRGYLSLPWSGRGDPSEVTGPLATLRIATFLCSTRFSQDRVVLGLLKWREGMKEDIPTLLKQVVFVPEIELVKLLSDVLDALFGILVEYQGNEEYEDLVFTALVRVLGIVHDRRFDLGPLVERYAENKFNYPFATPCLVRSFTRLLSNPTDPETARKLRATFKVVRHILKFITHARGQQKVKEVDIGLTGSTPGFTRHLQSIFKALDSMMRSTAPVLVGSQTLAVQHFHTWLPELTGLLSTEEILHIAIDFMDACSMVKGKLVLYKLVLIIKYAQLDLFSQPDQRSVLLANTVRWIAPHWGRTDQVNEQWKEQVRLCCSVVASQMDQFGAEISDYVPKIVDSYLAIQQTTLAPKSRLSLLFPTAYPFPSRPVSGDPVMFDETLIELSAVLSAMSNSSSGMQLELVERDLTVLVENILRVHMSILQGEAFPPTWLSVHIFHHKSTMKTLQYLAGILFDSFLPHPDDAENFDTDLWKMFFTTLLKLVGSDCLALETFPEQKRRTIWKIAGDVRENGAALLRETWEAIGWETSPDERKHYGLSKMGGYQVQYVPTLVGPIVELCLSVHEGLRRMAVEVLQTMIVSEWTLSEDLSVIQTEMIDYLDSFFKDQTPTESILQKMFIDELFERFEPLSHIPDEPLYAALKDLVATIDEYLDLLVAVHGGDVTGEASHLINRLRLMEFLRDMQKEEIFIRYVHQLAALQAGARNHQEAGLALRLHADLYDWDPTRTTGPLQDPDLPPQTHFERKERIYFDMIKHFEDGEAWSCAVAAYKELKVQYETNVFDFAKLARTERAIATIYETLAKRDRVVPKYFKVSYKGLGFPTSLRDKEFIYEGSPAERTAAFTDRMQEQHPSASVVTSGDADTDGEGQYLVVSGVSPHRDLGHHVFQRARVPPVVRDYLLSSSPQAFSVSSKRSTTGPVSEHCAQKIVYTTAEPFPTILRRSEIVAVSEVRLDAKETALERIVRKTQEMAAVEKRLLDGDDGVAQLLVDAISISVNPDSEHSVARYRQLLPAAAAQDDEDEEEEEEEAVDLGREETAIRMALVDHAIMLKRCLTGFSRSQNEILRKGYENFYKHFESTFAPEIAIFTPAQPTRDDRSVTCPSWRRSSPVAGSAATPPPPSSPARGSPFATPAVREGATAQEAAAAVAPSAAAAKQQRGTRLSFLSGRRKESSTSSRPSADSRRDADAAAARHPPPPPPPPPSRGKENNAHHHRRSFFRPPSNDTSHSSSGHALVNGGPDSGDGPRHSGSGDVFGGPGGGPLRERGALDGGLARMDSVKRRLSLLKLGRKTITTTTGPVRGPMGGLQEE